MIFHQQLRLSAWRRGLVRLAVAGLVLAPVTAQAAGLAPRSVQLGSSGPGVSTNYAVQVTTATTASLGSIKFELCSTPTGACTTPSGLVSTSATLTAQSGATGFVMVNTANGAPYITRSAAAVGAGTGLAYTLGGITNPSTANQTFYVRVTTYTGSDGATGPVDTGTVAVSTAQPVQLTGVTPEILVFCVGTSITSNCTSVSGSTIDFGDFSPTGTNTGTSVMQAQTNAANGYTISVNGTTLASGAHTIAALSGGGTSTIGTSQFGLNLKANTVPAEGAEVSGTGLGTAATGYNTSNQFRFATGQAVATAGAPTDANTFTSSYLVNIGGAQAAGVYTATMTYICTASF